MKRFFISLAIIIGAVTFAFAQKTPGEGRGIETGGKKPRQIKKELAKQNKKQAKAGVKDLKKRERRKKRTGYYGKSLTGTRRNSSLPFLKYL